MPLSSATQRKHKKTAKKTKVVAYKGRSRLSPYNVKTLSILAGGSSCTHSVIPISTAAIKAFASFVVKDCARFARLKHNKTITSRHLTRSGIRHHLPVII